MIVNVFLDDKKIGRYNVGESMNIVEYIKKSLEHYCKYFDIKKYEKLEIITELTGDVIYSYNAKNSTVMLNYYDENGRYMFIDEYIFNEKEKSPGMVKEYFEKKIIEHCHKFRVKHISKFITTTYNCKKTYNDLFENELFIAEPNVFIKDDHIRKCLYEINLSDSEEEEETLEPKLGGLNIDIPIF